MGNTVIEPKVLDGIDLEGRVFIPVSDWRVIPELSSALAGLLRLVPLALKVGPDGNAFGLCDVHRLKCYTDKRDRVREGREPTEPRNSTAAPWRQKPRTAGPVGHGANGSRFRFDPSKGRARVGRAVSGSN